MRPSAIVHNTLKRMHEYDMCLKVLHQASLSDLLSMVQLSLHIHVC